jgi:hypothetical protein
MVADAERMRMKILTTVMLTVFVGALAGVVFIYSGAFDGGRPTTQGARVSSGSNGPRTLH